MDCIHASQKASEQYDQPYRSVKVGTALFREAGSFCFNSDKHLGRFVEEAIFDALIREGHDWLHPELAAATESRS